jgi:predicted O-methyltransferase YrrM
MEILSSALKAYVETHTAPEPELLYHLNRITRRDHLYPRMVSGHWQGRFLSFLSKLIQPEFILEIGTYTGYATLCLAEGLQPSGKIVTLEIDPELRLIAEQYFTAAEKTHQIDLLNGPALEIIPQLNYPWDMVFIDAEKYEYQDYLIAVLPQVKIGGVILVDNVLWSGQVADPSFQDKKTNAIRNFNDWVLTLPELEVIMLPVRDGITLIRKVRDKSIQP